MESLSDCSKLKFSHLQPMLQEAIQKDGIDRSQYVKGPLTWSEFVRVGDKTCNISKSDIAPLPIPQLQAQVEIHCKVTSFENFF